MISSLGVQLRIFIKDFGYLLNMPMLSLSKEKREELLEQRDNKPCFPVLLTV